MTPSELQEMPGPLISPAILVAFVGAVTCAGLALLVVHVHQQAVLAGNASPEILLLSARQRAVFLAEGFLLACGAIAHYRNRLAVRQAEHTAFYACSRRTSSLLYYLSLSLYLMGAGLAYTGPSLFR